MTDRELGMHRPIARRDFLNGMAIGLTALGTAPLAWPAAAGNYPPALTGLRGSHPGSFEALHGLRDGTRAGKGHRTGERYDLVIVGGGISGLAGAWFYRQQAGPKARLLILDNHDDFGGHARRNEFQINGKLQLMNGGTLEIDSPRPYSAVADGLLKALGVEPEALAKRFPRADPSRALGMQRATFFDAETFGEDRLVIGTVGAGGMSWTEFLGQSPLSTRVREDIVRLEEGRADYLPGLTEEEKKDKLSRMSYRDFLLQVAKTDAGVIPFYQARTHGEYGIGIDAVSALDCWVWDLPGFAGMGLTRRSHPRMGDTAAGYADGGSYRFHFPDGNASIARLLVRSLIPEAVTGGPAAEDIVTARVDYGMLDRAGAAVRIRLGSPVVNVRHRGRVGSAKEVEVSYVGRRGVETVRAKHCLAACWMGMIPHVFPEVPAEQREAMRYGVKVPLVYTTVGLRDWKAFQKLGVARVASPGMFHSSFQLDFGPEMGGYVAAKNPEEPVLVSMLRTPCRPGLDERAQHRAGRQELLDTPFAEFERKIRQQLARVLGDGGGFDAGRDIEAITVNRWPHGYAYEYNPLFDAEWEKGEAPHEVGRRRFGRVAIANADAGASAYTDAAVDQAYRAVGELVGRLG